jgi:hypothetical protein
MYVYTTKTKQAMKKIIYIIICLASAFGANAQTTAGKINNIADSANLTFNGTTAQVIPNATAFTNQGIYNLTVNNTAGVSGGGSGYLNVLGTLTLTNGTFTLGGSLYLAGAITPGSGFIQSNSKIVGFYGTTAAQVIPNTVFVSNTIGSLYIRNTLGVSSTGYLIVPSTLALQAGTFTLGGNLDIGGTITYTAGNIVTGTNTVTFNGSSSQTIPAGTFAGNSLGNLVISNSSGITAASSLAVSSSLGVASLDSGTIPLTVTGTASIAGALNITGFLAAPTTGQQFTIVSATSVSGTFASLSLPAGYSGTMSYTSALGKLTITGVPAGFKQFVTATPISTDKPADVTSVKIYPNPVKSNCTVQCDKVISDVVVYNSMGRIVKKTANINSYTCGFNLVGLMQGEYVFVITIAGNQVAKNVLKVD